jgi:subtilisin-like proprotein convertase family protein
MNMKTSTRHSSAAFLSPIRSGLLALALASGLSASAQTTTTTTNFTVGTTVPDNDVSGLASAKIISTPIAYVTSLKVNLKLSGTFNGNLYAYLAHGRTNAILLNRVGCSASSNLGYDDKGFDLVFDDASTNGDVHVYRTKLGGPISGPLTSSWAPDGRRSNPTNVATTDSRTALLNVFNGMNPNGEWVLFVADMVAGDSYRVENWGLEITGYTPPSIASSPANATAEGSSDSAQDTTAPVADAASLPAMPNHAPLVGDITMGAVENHSRNLSLDKVQPHCYDQDNDVMTLAVSATSTNGGIVTLSTGGITYTPVANFIGTDAFTYTVNDGRGGTASAMVIVQVSSASALTPNITGMTFTAPGTFTMRFAGIPGFTYHIERTGSLSSPNWTDIASMTAPEDGQVVFTDSNAPSGSAYYRTAAPLP